MNQKACGERSGSDFRRRPFEHTGKYRQGLAIPSHSAASVFIFSRAVATHTGDATDAQASQPLPANLRAVIRAAPWRGCSGFPLSAAWAHSWTSFRGYGSAICVQSFPPAAHPCKIRCGRPVTPQSLPAAPHRRANPASQGALHVQSVVGFCHGMPYAQNSKCTGEPARLR